MCFLKMGTHQDRKISVLLKLTVRIILELHARKNAQEDLWKITCWNPCFHSRSQESPVSWYHLQTHSVTQGPKTTFTDDVSDQTARQKSTKNRTKAITQANFDVPTRFTLMPQDAVELKHLALCKHHYICSAILTTNLSQIMCLHFRDRYFSPAACCP